MIRTKAEAEDMQEAMIDARSIENASAQSVRRFVGDQK